MGRDDLVTTPDRVLRTHSTGASEYYIPAARVETLADRLHVHLAEQLFALLGDFTSSAAQTEDW